MLFWPVQDVWGPGKAGRQAQRLTSLCLALTWAFHPLLATQKAAHPHCFWLPIPSFYGVSHHPGVPATHTPSYSFTPCFFLD